MSGALALNYCVVFYNERLVPCVKVTLDGSYGGSGGNAVSPTRQHGMIKRAIIVLAGYAYNRRIGFDSR